MANWTLCRKIAAVGATAGLLVAPFATGCGTDDLETVEDASGMSIVESAPGPAETNGDSDAEDSADSGNEESQGSSTSSSETSSSSSSGVGTCDQDSEADAIYRATAEVNEKYPNQFGGWEYVGDSNYDTCSPLTYAYLRQAEVGNSQFGTKLLMFNEGKYLGIDSTYSQQAMNVEPNDNGFTVTYKDWETAIENGAGGAQMSNYRSEVTYYWDGSKVAHEGRIPNVG